MKSKTIIITFVIGFVLASLLIWGYAQDGNTAAAVQGIVSGETESSLVSTDTVYNFGSISMKDGDVTKDFVLMNPTNADIIIRNIETSCMCTSALLIRPDGSTKGPFGMVGMGGLTTTDDIVKAGETRTVRVVYDPKAHGPAGVGNIDRFVTITDASGGTIRFEIKAIVIP